MSDREGPANEARPGIATLLLAGGVVYALLYAVVNDLVAAPLYDGYSRTSQAISELSATSAPTKGILTAMLPIFTALMLAFGLGVWKSAGPNRALRVTGALLMTHAATFPLWWLAPMTSRPDMQQGVMPANDFGHIVLSVTTVLLILAELGSGAAALGRRFGVYSVMTVVAVVAFGVLTAIEAPKVPLGEATPWMGLFERISVAAWLLWLFTLSIVLLRRPPRAAGSTAAVPLVGK